MGLSHGGLRQKAFNAYEETIHIPLVVSNPVLFPKPARDRRARLADRPAADDRHARPARRLDGRARGRDLIAGPRRAGRRPSASACDAPDVDLGPVTDHPSPAPTRSRTRSTSPMTTTRRRPRCRTSRASRTGSAPSARRGTSSRSTSTRPAARRPSTRCTTSSATRTRATTWSTGARGKPLSGTDTPLRSELGQRLDRLMAVNGTAPG